MKLLRHLFFTLFFFSAAFAPNAMAQTQAGPVRLSVPPDSSVTPIPFPDFRWEADPNAFNDLANIVEYEIQISIDRDFRNPVIQDSIAVARYVPSQPLSTGNYFWRVRALRGNSVVREWSAPSSLVVKEVDEKVYVERRDGATDDGNAVSIALNRVRQLLGEGKSVELVFPSGVYTTPPVSDGVFISLKDAENLIVSGYGAQVNLSTYDSTFINLNNCKNILVQGFEIDIPTQPMTSQGRVISVDHENVSFVAEFDENSSTFEDSYLRNGRGAVRLLDPVVNGRLKTGVETWYRINQERTEDLGKRRYRIYLKRPSYRTEKGVVTLADNTGRLIRYFEKGDRFVYDLETDRSALAFVQSSEKVTFHEMTDYSGNRHYWAYESSEMHYIRTRSLIKEGRWFNGSADGIHVRSAAVGPWIEEVEINGIGDDAIALYARPNLLLPVTENLANNELLVNTDRFFNLEPDNEVSLYRPTSGEILLESFVVDVRKIDGSTALVRLRDPIPVELIHNAEWTASDQIWNRSKSCGDFVVRNSKMRNIRRYGTVFRAKGGLIENNLYEGVSAAAIIFVNEPQYPNGLYASEIIIRNNVITDSAFDTMPTNVISFLFKQPNGGVATISMGPRNILIENNKISNCVRPPMEFWSAQNVLLRGNTVDGKPLKRLSEGHVRNSTGIIFKK